MSLYGNGVGRLGGEGDVIPASTLRDYIAFARATCFPALQPEAANVSCCVCVVGGRQWGERCVEVWG